MKDTTQLAGRMDVEDRDDGTQRPNAEMVLYSRIEEVLGGLR